MFILIALLSVILYKLEISIALLVFYIARFYYNRRNYPPGPFPLPLIGNVHQMTPGKMQFNFERWRKEYGDVYTFWIFNNPYVILMRTEVIKEALVDNGELFENRSGDLFESVFQLVENGGIIFASGESWRKQRRTALHFLRDVGVGKALLDSQIQHQVQVFLSKLEDEEDLNAVDLQNRVQNLTASVISHILYGNSKQDSKRLMLYVDSLSLIMKEMQQNLLVAFYQIMPSIRKIPYIGYKAIRQYEEKYRWCLDHVKEDVNKSLEGYSVDQEPECFAQAYYQKIKTAKDENLTLEQLHNICGDFFFAGMESTAATLLWMLIRLAGNQDAQERIRKEIASNIGFDRLPNTSDKAKMPFTQSCLFELQRISNIAPMNMLRRAKKATTVAGFNLQKGTVVLPQVYGALIDEGVFEHAMEFKPDRFLKKDGRLNNELMAKTLIFGTGKRQCAGESLAKTELFISLTSILQRFKVFPSAKHPLDFSPVPATILYPARNTLKLQRVDPNDYQ